MPNQVTNHKCPSCTGPLHFSSESGKLECDFCGKSYTVAEIEALYADKEAKAAEAKQDADAKETEEDIKIEETEWDTSSLTDDWGEDGKKMKAYNCPSCGAQLICDENTAATSCPYCGNPAVVPGQLTGALKPDYVIPFNVSKDEAVAALKNHYKGKFFLPKSFKSENHIQEIRGIYVPFWLFDGEAVGSANYKAAITSTYRSGNYEVTQTKHFNVHRSGSIAFEKIPVDASSKMPDDHMDSIEPYNYGELKPFSTAYLPGYLADKYDVSIENCVQRADVRCKNTLEAALRATVTGYTRCITQSTNIGLKRGKVHYALLPVWMLNTKWNGKEFLFAMNGQTGKLIGDLPMDWKKFWLTFFAIMIPIAVIVTVIMMYA